MAPQRNADAANISPYRYPYVSQSSSTLGPGPSNASSAQEASEQPGRTDSKGKKGKVRPQRAERSPREEEPKFNTGPRNLRAGAPAANRGRRGFRIPGRAYPEDQSVPDYPPPSFLEAMNTPPVSMSASTVSLLSASVTNLPLLLPPENTLSSIPESAQPVEVVLSPPTPMAEQPAQLLDEYTPTAEEPTPVDTTSDSDTESLFIIDMHSVPVGSTDFPRGKRKSKTDWLLRRGGENKGKTSMEFMKQNGDTTPKTKPVRLPPLEIDPKPTSDQLKRGLETPLSSPRRKLLSLSPLRTMFPPKSPVHDGRAMTAHPLPSPTLYGASRSAFFRSSSSLATVFLPSLPSISGNKGENLTRKIFSHKAKDRSSLTVPAEQSKPSAEDLNRWELLNKSAYANVDEQGIEHPESLMSAMAAFRSVDTLGGSPTRSQGFSFSGGGPNYNNQSRVQFRESTEMILDTSELSLRDLKVHHSSPAFIDRPLNRKTLVSPSTTTLTGRSSNVTTPTVSNFTSPSTATLTSRSSDFTNVSSSAMSLSNLSLPLTPVRAMTPPSTLLAKRATIQPTITAYPSPLRVDAKPMLTLNNQSTSAFILQKALETPLPATPLLRAQFDYVGSPNGETYSAAIVQVPDMLSDSFSDQAPSTSSSRIPPLNVLTVISSHQPHIASPSLDSPISASDVLSPLEEPMTPTRHHYTGRPLPRPPPSITVTTPRAGSGVDSTYDAAPWTPDLQHDGADKDEHPRSYANNPCPEGLLIDLEDTTLDYSPVSGSSTPRSDVVESLVGRHLPGMMSHSASSVSLSMNASATPGLSGTQGGGAGTPPSLRSLTPSPVRTPPQQQGAEVFSELTDLDLLLARVAERAARDGSDYETLLMVSELIGPATPPRRRSPSPSAPGQVPGPASASASINPNSNGNICLIGRIEFARRRQTGDGRIKVKIKLFDVSVDKCAVCLSQFRDHEMAVMTSVCQHAFHERVPLDTDMDIR
ncbi:hypothetical protein D9619_007868 [Psilocybe cf. subviscida]|uniref:Uncharacterized protein n=1 Tax=Psilocybe cf. subviscida TaxID=2480587 RepID=A0A8H5ATP8_9AGAR|nr:hypothetical protein D9619_007868 [Psilocybe cf. subviscida]